MHFFGAPLRKEARERDQVRLEKSEVLQATNEEAGSRRGQEGAACKMCRQG